MRKLARWSAVPCAASALLGCDTAWHQLPWGPPLLFLALHLILAVLLCFVLWDWLRLEPESRTKTALCLTAAAVSFLVLIRMDVRGIPPGWVTILHEGTGRSVIGAVMGGGAHAGPNLLAVMGWSSWKVPRLLYLVRMNLALASLNSFIYLLMAWRILGLWPACALTLCFALNRVALHSALSELPAQLMTTYVFACVPAAAVLHRGAGRDRVRAWAAAGVVAAASLLLLWTRVDMGIAGIVATALALARVSRPAGPIDGPDFLTEKLLRVAAWKPRDKILLLSALALLSWPARRAGAWQWLADGLRPLNPSLLLLPAAVQGFLPLGVVVLFVAGGVYAFRRLGWCLGLPASLLVLFRIYHSASQGRFCVMFRFMTYLTPMIFLLALFGWEELRSMLRRRGCGRAACSAAAAALLALCLVPPSRALQFLYQGEDSGGRAWWGLCDGHLQREARFLLGLQRLYPDRVFVAKNVADSGALNSWKSYQWTFFGDPLPYALAVPKGQEGVAEAVARQGRLSALPLYYYGTDCSLRDAEGCEEDVRGLRLVQEERFVNPRFCEPSQYGDHTPIIRLAAYEFPGAAPGLPTLPRADREAAVPARAWPKALEAAWLGLRRVGAAVLGPVSGAFRAPSWPEQALAALGGGQRDKARAIMAMARPWPRAGQDLPARQWLDLAHVAAEAGDAAAALTYLDHADGRALSAPDAAELARLYASLGRKDRALALLGPLLALKPSGMSARSWLDSAYAAWAAGDKASALRALAAGERAGEDAGQEHEAALLLQSLGEYGRALKAMDSLLSREPGKSVYWSDRGVLKVLMGRKEDARGDLRRALRLDPANEAARLTLAGLSKP